MTISLDHVQHTIARKLGIQLAFHSPPALDFTFRAKILRTNFWMQLVKAAATTMLMLRATSHAWQRLSTTTTRTSSNKLLSASAKTSTRFMSSSTTTPQSLLDSISEGGKKSWAGNNVADAMHALYTADAVCFDVDSTVIAEEGIDTLAEYLGKGEEVAALTKEAMEGGMKFQDALKLRLELLRPARQSIQTLLKEQPLVLTENVEYLMKALKNKSVDVWLVSGGFRIMIEPVASQLNIPTENILANTILFDDDGNYLDFDPNEPTSRDMGKPKALEMIESQKHYHNMVMVGDGATDAQAKPPAKAFIGFGGVIERAAVKEKADWFVTDFADMSKIVDMR